MEAVMSTITVDVDIDDVLEQLDDEDLMREVRERGLKVAETHPPKEDSKERLEAIYHHMRMRQSKVAYKLMYDYVRDVLGKAV